MSSTNPSDPAFVASTKVSSKSNASSLRKIEDDPAWQYIELLIPGNYQKMRCKLCKHQLSGGISSAKEHFIQKKGNVKSCNEVTSEIMYKIKKYVTDFEAKNCCIGLKYLETRNQKFADEGHEEELDALEVEGWSGASSKKRKENTSSTKDPMNLFMKVDHKKQTTLDRNNPSKVQLQKKAWKSLAMWAFEAGVPFHAFEVPSFQKAIYAIGEYGPLMEAPSIYHLRTTLLKEVYEDITKFVDSFRVYWRRGGCSIMSDLWKNGRGQTLINFLVNCDQGTIFLKSIDASELVKKTSTIVTMIEEVIIDVGPENIVQFITVNDANFKAAGEILEKRYPTMFWTPCAAHCCNLILQDMGEKILRVKSVLLQARSIVVYIYNHGRVLKLMHKYVKGELHKSCVTRFASQFYSLQSLMHNYDALRMMFVTDAWTKSEFPKKVEGARIADLVVRDVDFWKDVAFACSIMAPIVDVLRLVITKEKPCMGYIYDAMAHAKELIQKNMGEDKAASIDARQQCREIMLLIWEIIDKRWECQLHRPLHAAGFYLNPGTYYNQVGPDNSLALEGNEDVKNGLHAVFDRFVKDPDMNQKLYEEVILYRDGMKSFKRGSAKRLWENLTLSNWWISFGTSAPILQKLAVRVLNQTCSASPFEHNWSAFDNIHSKKRNCLLAKKLNDIVYIQYNKKLKRRFKAWMNEKDDSDPIILKEVDENDDWVIPTDEELANFVREGDDLEWNQVDATMDPRREKASGRGLRSLHDDDDFFVEEHNHVDGEG